MEVRWGMRGAEGVTRGDGSCGGGEEWGGEGEERDRQTEEAGVW